MSSQLAFDASSTLAAVAPVASLRLPSPCPSSRPVAVVAFHGTAHPIDPYEGKGRAYWTYSVPVAAQRWGTFDHCQPTPTVTSGTGYTLTSYPACLGGSAVQLYTLIGEGHEWPGGPDPPSEHRRFARPPVRRSRCQRRHVGVLLQPPRVEQFLINVHGPAGDMAASGDCPAGNPVRWRASPTSLGATTGSLLARAPRAPMGQICAVESFV